MWIRHAGLHVLIRPKHPDQVRLRCLRVRVRIGGIPVPHVVPLCERVVDKLDLHVRTVRRGGGPAPAEQRLDPGKFVG